MNNRHKLLLFVCETCHHTDLPVTRCEIAFENHMGRVIRESTCEICGKTVDMTVGCKGYFGNKCLERE